MLCRRIDDLQRQLAASDGRSTAILSRLEERLTKAQMREAAAMQHEGHGMKLMAVTVRVCSNNESCHVTEPTKLYLSSACRLDCMG